MSGSAMKIYVASSWRNTVQPEVVRLLRAEGFEVYDFKDPANDKGAFHWSDVMGPGYGDVTPGEFIEYLRHPRCEEGFRQDFDHMVWADACVLVLPAGRSANLEAGWFVGAGKKLVILKDHGTPDLMYKMANRIVPKIADIPGALREEAET